MLFYHPLTIWTRSSSLKCGFNKPGKYAMNGYRAVLISGSPGIGKTTAAHLAAKAEGFTPVELNASDARSKKLVEVCGYSCRFLPALKGVKGRNKYQ